MDQEPTIKDEGDLNKRVESDKDGLEEKGAELLESPPSGDFAAGLRAFITWVQSLLAKKD